MPWEYPVFSRMRALCLFFLRTQRLHMMYKENWHITSNGLLTLLSMQKRKKFNYSPKRKRLIICFQAQTKLKSQDLCKQNAVANNQPRMSNVAEKKTTMCILNWKLTVPGSVAVRFWLAFVRWGETCDDRKLQ